MSRKLFLFSGALALLVALGCSRSQMDTGVSPAHRTDRPTWVKEQGIVMVGNWEPLIFRLRLGGRHWGTDVVELVR